MASTIFTNQQTVIQASWLNDVNAATYTTLPAVVTTLNNIESPIGSSLVGYTQGSTYSSNRSVQSKLQESVSVKDFGAIGDGVTDDTTAITNAIQAGINNGFKVYFPAGVYVCNALSFNGSSTKFVKIVGDGPDSQILQKQLIGSGAWLQFTAFAQIHISGIYFNGGNYAEPYAGGISFVNSNDIKFINNQISYFNYIPVSFLGCSDVDVKENLFTNNGLNRSALSVPTSTFPMVWVGDNGGSQLNYRVALDNNHFVGNQASACTFYPVGGSIRGNKLYNNGEAAFFVPSPYADSIICTDNIIDLQTKYDAVAFGIEFQASNSVISNNKISNTQGGGIIVYDCQNVIVNNNIIKNSGTASLSGTSNAGLTIWSLQNTTTRVTNNINAYNNIIVDSQVTPTTNNGIAIGLSPNTINNLNLHDNQLIGPFKTGSVPLYIDATTTVGQLSIIKDNVGQASARPYIGSISQSSTGVFTVSGIGFKPRMIQFMASDPTTFLNYSFSTVTVTESGTVQTINLSGADNGTNFANNSASDRIVFLTTATGTARYELRLVSVNSDGFVYQALTTNGLTPYVKFVATP
jgi:parallel beta-helix repeat protein